MKINLLILCLLSGGCAMIPSHAINLDIKGHNLETPYGKIEDGEIHVHTIWGSKTQSVVTPLETNNVGVGTTANASIPVSITLTPAK